MFKSKDEKQAESFSHTLKSTLDTYTIDTDKEEEVKKLIAKFYSDIYLMLNKEKSPVDKFIQVLDTMAETSSGLSDGLNFHKLNS
jgi:hypothetical protein